MRWFKKDKDYWPSEFNDLAVYNAETHRGLMHTEEWKKRMEEVQKRFNEWQRNHLYKGVNW